MTKKIARSWSRTKLEHCGVIALKDKIQEDPLSEWYWFNVYTDNTCAFSKNGVTPTQWSITLSMLLTKCSDTRGYYKTTGPEIHPDIKEILEIIIDKKIEPSFLGPANGDLLNRWKEIVEEINE